MKKILIMLLIFNSILYANELKTEVDGKIQFEIIETDRIDYQKYGNDPTKVMIWVNTTDNKEFTKVEPESWSPLFYNQLKRDGYKINKQEIIKMNEANDYKTSRVFTFEANTRMNKGKLETVNYIPKSYRKLIVNNQMVGEYYMHLTEADYPLHYEHKYFNITYYINFVLSDRIVHIDLNLIWGDTIGIIEACPELFEVHEDGNYYWKNKKAQSDFVEIFNSDDYKKLPESIRLLRETRDLLLDTLVIND